MSAEERRRARAAEERRRLEHATVRAAALGRIAEAAETLRYADSRFQEAALAAQKRGASLKEIEKHAGNLPGFSRSSLGTKLRSWKAVRERETI